MSPTHDVFLSFKNLDPEGQPTRDSHLARQVHDLLTATGVSVFCSSVSLEQLGVADYKQAIDSALDSARILVAVGTTAENLSSPWVRYEWDGFLIDILSGFKPGGQVFVFLEDGDKRSLPPALRRLQVVSRAEGGLERLVRFVGNGLKQTLPKTDDASQARAGPVSAEVGRKKQNASAYVEEQLAKLRPREELLRAQGNDQALMECIEDQIRLANPQMDPDEFMRLLKEQERLFGIGGNPDGLAAALGNQLRLLLRREMFEASRAVGTKLETLLRGMGSKVRLKDCLGWQAEALLRTGDPHGAMVMRKEEQALAAAISDEDGIANSLGGQAEVHKSLGDARQALDVLKQQEAIYRNRANYPGLGRCLFNQSRILAWEPARRDEASQLAEKSLRLARNHGLQGLANEIEVDLIQMRQSS